MRQSLDGNWELSFIHPESREPMTVPAQVPGNVVADLVRAGVAADPYQGDNVHALRMWEFVDFTYSTSFHCEKPQPGERLELVFCGVDTIAEAQWNGRLLGEMRNMFIDHRFDVTGLLDASGMNSLKVKVKSAVNEARKFPRAAHTFALSYNYESLYLRKAGHTFGWDIAPRIVPGGLWRSVGLERIAETRWTDVLIYTTFASKHRAALTVDWSFETAEEMLTGFSAKLRLAHGASVVAREFHVDFVSGKWRIEIPEPHLWWPRNLGEAALYTVTLELCRNGELLSTWTGRTGVRTVRLERTETLSAGGEGEFRFTVNGEPLFVLGANHVPVTAMHGEAPERVIKALELFDELGCNMVRSWGGGVYEDHGFFDYCDEHGMLVWQDFMFGCEIPPQDDWFCREVEAEAEAVIRKLRNHPSLALWCGDNECDEATMWGGDGQLPSDNRITREILLRAVRRHDPGRDYLPSSPYLTDRNAMLRDESLAPEQHLWGPRDDFKGDFYRRNTARFASETGYHGMPEVASLKKFLSPDKLFPEPDNAEYLAHASQPFGYADGAYAYRIKLLLDQIKNMFGKVPEDLEQLVTASQIVQAEALKFFIENFRLRKWNKTGLLWWNVIDCWPQISDAVVDYYYGKKLAYFYVKNAQQPVYLMMGEPEAWHCEVRIANEFPHPAAGEWRVSDLLSGEVFGVGNYECGANAGAGVGKIRVSTGEHRMFLLEWTVGGVWKRSHYLLGHPPFDLAFYERCLERMSIR